ncbi:substrate-binding domain-containing protein [Motilimonas sp. KMU-193]|uniref:substrate-binding domain-containing protein n=1 Tax=Motilimonas sp. KMU-193 TaxID=3388668 RepID=UPI00396AFCE0
MINKVWQQFVSIFARWVVIPVSIVFGLSACAPAPVKIALVVPDLTNPFFQTMANTATQYASSRGYQLILINSMGSSDHEYEQVVAAHQAGAQALLLVPSKANQSAKTLSYANQHNWPVISIDRNVNAGEVALHISSDNYMGAKMAGEYLLALTHRQGNILELIGPMDISVSQDRNQGFADVLEAYQQPSTIKAVANFSQQKAQQITAAMLDQHPHIRAIFAHNDEMALGAAAAIAARPSLNPQIAIVGFDGTPAGLKAVQQGRINATLVQQPDAMITAAINSAVNIINGATPTPYLKVPLRLAQHNEAH